mmetsp:Transcript_57385/g.158855  ORF Transcript_57385/g.158855 Transcript_57385/m.158855 type:complete len:245 (-) Transcript_57385:103-837(-)
MAAAAVVSAVIGAPLQQNMVDEQAAQDVFKGYNRIMIKQEWAAIELCDIEAKQRYRVSVPDGNKEGAPFLYVTEESNCCERICCSTNRSLTLKLHNGASKDYPVVQKMKKPFSCQGCCCMRPSFEVFGPGEDEKIGKIEDPCRCCVMDQQIFDASDNLIYTTNGSICQCGMCCPLCASVDFEVRKDGQAVGAIRKNALTCADACVKTNSFTVDFGGVTEPNHKRMIFAAAMLLDLEYFEANKNN